MKLGIYIGRFQPMHIGHLAIVERASKECDQVILFLGQRSSWDQPTIRNPIASFRNYRLVGESVLRFGNVKVETLTDIPGRDLVWKAQILDRVGWQVDWPRDTVILYGCNKDDSTYYLNLFPEFAASLSDAPLHDGISATKVRGLIYSGDPSWESLVAPPYVRYFQSNEWRKTFTELQLDQAHTLS